MENDLFDMGENDPLPATDTDVQPSELDLSLLIDLLNSTPDMAIRERIELSQKVTVMQKNQAQTRKAEVRDTDNSAPGVIVVPVKLPLGKWADFALAEVNGARDARR